MSFDHCKRVLENVKHSGAVSLLTTTSAPVNESLNVTCEGFRNRNFQEALFGIPEPILAFSDSAVSEDRLVALWRVSDI